MNLILVITVFNLVLSTFIIWKLLPSGVKKNGGSTVLLDTSAIMDGRVVEVVKSGFVPEQLLVPRFVIAELQLLADKADHLKRERARYGLQVIQTLQDSKYTTVSIISDDIKSESGVDEKLVKLALKLKALLFTTDYNLLKVAEIEGVRVLNINELAQNLRPTRIPGEYAEIKIVAKGQEKSQGVGYLEDGTMVVVENAGAKQGQFLKVEFTRNLQTTAGRMMFAKSVNPRQEKNSQPPQPTATKSPRPQTKRYTSKKQSDEDKLIATINAK
jgi:uncharacterized protein YacL